MVASQWWQYDCVTVASALKKRPPSEDEGVQFSKVQVVMIEDPEQRWSHHLHYLQWQCRMWRNLHRVMNIWLGVEHLHHNSPPVCCEVQEVKEQSSIVDSATFSCLRGTVSLSRGWSEVAEENWQRCSRNKIKSSTPTTRVRVDIGGCEVARYNLTIWRNNDCYS